MAFPPAHFLVGCGVAELVRAAVPLPRWRAWLVAGTLAVSPDFDFIVGLAARNADAYHGTFTHSLLAVAVVALIGGVIGGPRWAALAGAGYGSHLLVDLLDDRGRTNVLLGWPFTLEQPYAIARVFPTIPFQQGEGVWGAMLSLLEPPVLAMLALQTLTGLLLFLLLLLAAAAVRRLRQLPP